MRIKLLAIVVSLTLLLYLIWAAQGSPEGLGTAPARVLAAGPAGLSPSETTAARAEDEPAGRRQGVAGSGQGGAATESGTAAALDDAQLKAALLQLSQVSMESGEELEQALMPFLSSRPNLLRVIQLVQGHGLNDTGERLSALEKGALRLFPIAASVLHAGTAGGTSTITLAMEVRDYLDALLRALPNIFEPAQSYLAGVLSGLVDAEGLPIIDLTYASLIEELAAAYPEHADLLLSILENASAGLDPADARVTDNLNLHDLRSPRLLSASLSRLLRESDAPRAMAVATELFLREDSPQALKDAISTAISLSAPPELATDFLSEHGTPFFLDEFYNLGNRDGGAEAIQKRYYDERISGSADASARVLMVSGMRALDQAEMMAIAIEDPSPRVRAQAWINLLGAKNFRPTRAVLDALEDAYSNLGHPELGLSADALMQNLDLYLSRAKSGRHFRAARRLLERLAEDKGLKSQVRDRVQLILERYKD